MNHSISRVLIVGGTGFMGQEISRTLREFGYEVYSLSRDWQKVPNGYSRPCKDYFLGDAWDRDTLTSVLNKVDPLIVINCAAIKDVIWCEKLPRS